MNWDGNKTNDYFIRLYESQNPERYKTKPKHGGFDDLHDIELALKDLYSICAQNAWTKEELIKALDNVMKSPSVNVKAKKSEKYLTAKKDTALKIQDSIKNNSFEILLN